MRAGRVLSREHGAQGRLAGPGRIVAQPMLWHQWPNCRSWRSSRLCTYRFVPKRGACPFNEARSLNFFDRTIATLCPLITVLRQNGEWSGDKHLVRSKIHLVHAAVLRAQIWLIRGIEVECDKRCLIFSGQFTCIRILTAASGLGDRPQRPESIGETQFRVRPA